jgi:hypothetical protein
VRIILIIDSGKGNDKNPFPLFIVVLSAEHTGEGIGIDRRLKLLIANRGFGLRGIIIGVMIGLIFPL